MNVALEAALAEFDLAFGPGKPERKIVLAGATPSMPLSGLLASRAPEIFRDVWLSAIARRPTPVHHSFHALTRAFDGSLRG